MGERTRMVEVRKLMAWNKDSFVANSKSITGKAKQGINHLLSMGRQVFRYSQESRALSYIIVTWEEKMPSVSFFLLPPTLYAKHNAIWYRVCWDQLSQLCPFWTLCSAPATCWWGEKQKRPWFCVSAAEDIPVLSMLSSTDPKHSHTEVIVPAKPITLEHSQCSRTGLF